MAWDYASLHSTSTMKSTFTPHILHEIFGFHHLPGVENVPKPCTIWPSSMTPHGTNPACRLHLTHSVFGKQFGRKSFNLRRVLESIWTPSSTCRACHPSLATSSLQTILTHHLHHLSLKLGKPSRHPVYTLKTQPDAAHKSHTTPSQLVAPAVIPGSFVPRPTRRKYQTFGIWETLLQMYLHRLLLTHESNLINFNLENTPLIWQSNFIQLNPSKAPWHQQDLGKIGKPTKVQVHHAEQGAIYRALKTLLVAAGVEK